MGVPEFTVDVFQNEYLPAGGREVNAVVTVTSACSTADGPAAAAGAAEIIIVDCSGSMAKPMARMIQAREAAAAIDVIRDGVAFAVVAGTSGARPVYPEAGSLAVADEHTREAAKGSLARLQPGSGTAIGKWLRYARELFETREDTLRHAILLTDGQNRQLPGRLAAEIKRCEMCVPRTTSAALTSRVAIPVA
jgi:Mg-chelatase subunit ChlD